MSKLLLTIRHNIFSGSFFDVGVKKFATTLPKKVSAYCFAAVDRYTHLLLLTAASAFW